MIYKILQTKILNGENFLSRSFPFAYFLWIINRKLVIKNKRGETEQDLDSHTGRTCCERVSDVSETCKVVKNFAKIYKNFLMKRFR